MTDIFDLYMAAALQGLCSDPFRQVLGPDHATAVAATARMVAEAAMTQRALHMGSLRGRDAFDTLPDDFEAPHG